MTDKPVRMWGVRAKSVRGVVELMPWTVKSTRRESIAALTENKRDWQRLYRFGYRCVRVIVTEEK